MSPRSNSLWSVNHRVHLFALTLSVRSNVSGIVIVLFFHCMGALLGPASRTGGVVKWGLVVHTVAMFSFLTILIALLLDIQSISYIDNREFAGASGAPWAGPLSYQLLIYDKAISVVPIIMFLLNNWLADGLLVCPLFNSVI